MAFSIIAGMSLSINSKGQITLDRSSADTKQLKEVINHMVPEWDGQDVFLDMTGWLNDKLKTIEDDFMDRYRNETLHLS